METIKKNKPTLLVAHLHFCLHTEPNKKCKRATSQRTQTDIK
jgi:hypothetical protein